VEEDMKNRRHENPVNVMGLLLVGVAFVIGAPHVSAQMNPEFCEVLNRFNAEKKITDPEVRARYEGEYGQADDTQHLRTWNIETACDEFLVAVPLWADVSPPVLEYQGGELFKDAMDSTWEFHVDDNGTVTGVTMTSATGKATDMVRLGDPRSFE
jgi:hypothetical protein